MQIETAWQHGGMIERKPNADSVWWLGWKHFTSKAAVSKFSRAGTFLEIVTKTETFKCCKSIFLDLRCCEDVSNARNEMIISLTHLIWSHVLNLPFHYSFWQHCNSLSDVLLDYALSSFKWTPAGIITRCCLFSVCAANDFKASCCSKLPLKFPKFQAFNKGKICSMCPRQ